MKFITFKARIRSDLRGYLLDNGFDGKGSTDGDLYKGSIMCPANVLRASKKCYYNFDFGKQPLKGYNLYCAELRSYIVFDWLEQTEEVKFLRMLYG